MEQLERLTARLENVQAVQPLLNALRAISSRSRLIALQRAEGVEQHGQDLLQMLALVSARISALDRRPHRSGADGTLVLVVIGSERGLCGAFNDVLVAYAEQLAAQYVAAGTQLQLVALGKRVHSALRSTEYSPSSSFSLSATALPSYDLAHSLVAEWLQAYQRHELDAVEVIYNAYQGLARYQPQLVRLLPPQLPPRSAQETEWPPQIETDPRCLFARLVELSLSARLYAILLQSAAAEHSARFQLLDGASQNAERLIDELKLFLQVARQDAITSELQDLAVGAGLLGRSSE
jgi:F-type H+-transporting ATPase subunit gamma